MSEETPQVPTLEAPGEIDPGPLREAEQPHLTPEQQLREVKDSLLDQLKAKYPDTVTDAWLDEQKRLFGRVYIFPIFDDIYLIRPLRRGEWKKLNEGKPAY